MIVKDNILEGNKLLPSRMLSFTIIRSRVVTNNSLSPEKSPQGNLNYGRDGIKKMSTGAINMSM